MVLNGNMFTGLAVFTNTSHFAIKSEEFNTRGTIASHSIIMQWIGGGRESRVPS